MHQSRGRAGCWWCALVVFIAGERETTAGLTLQPERHSNGGGPQIKRGRVKNITERSMRSLDTKHQRTLTYSRSGARACKHTGGAEADRSDATLQRITEAVTFS